MTDTGHQIHASLGDSFRETRLQPQALITATDKKA